MPTHRYDTDRDWTEMHGSGSGADLETLTFADQSAAWTHESDDQNVFAKFARAAIVANTGMPWGPENVHYRDWVEVVEDQPYN